MQSILPRGSGTESDERPRPLPHCSDICISTDSWHVREYEDGFAEYRSTALPVTRPSGSRSLLRRGGRHHRARATADHDARAQTWQAAANLAGATMTFTPIGLQASDIARSSRPDSAQRPRASRPHPARHPSGTPAPPPRPPPRRDAQDDRRRRPLPSWVGTEAHAGMARILTGCLTGRPRYPSSCPATASAAPATPTTAPAASCSTGSSSAPPPSATTRPTAPAPSTAPRSTSTASRSRLSPPRRRPRRHRVHPRAGLSSGIHLWAEDLDEQVCDDALRRWDAIVQVADTPGPQQPPRPATPAATGAPLRPRRHRPGHILRRHLTPDRHRDRDGTHEWKGTTMSTFTSPQPHPQASPTPTTSGTSSSSKYCAMSRPSRPASRQGRDRRDRPRRRPGTTAEDALLFPKVPSHR